MPDPRWCGWTTSDRVSGRGDGAALGRDVHVPDRCLDVEGEDPDALGGGMVEVAPDAVAERGMTIGRRGRVGERADDPGCVGCDGLHHAHLDHTATLAPDGRRARGPDYCPAHEPNPPGRAGDAARAQAQCEGAGAAAAPAGRAGPGRPRGRAARPRVPGTARDLCALVHDSPYQLLVATILSAQTTDEMVNKVTPALFARYPTPADLADADPEELEELVHSTGFFRSKAKNLIGMACTLEERFGGEVPTDLDDLTKLPGVGRKTGNVIRSVAFGLPGLPVDTHVGRLARRLKLTLEDDPVKAGARAQRPRRPRGAGCAVATPDPARPSGVRRPPSAVRRLRPQRHLPLRVQGVTRSSWISESLTRSRARPAVTSAALHRVQLGGDRRVRRVVVAVGEGEHPGRELFDLGPQRRHLGDIGPGAHGGQTAGWTESPAIRGPRERSRVPSVDSHARASRSSRLRR